MITPDYRVNLGAIELYTGTGRPRDGEWRFYLQDLDGWRTRSQDGTATSEHWSGQGGVPGPRRTPPRQITASGELLGTTAGTVESGMDALSRGLAATLTVAEDARAVVRQADVRVTQVMESRLSPIHSKVTLSLTADDPLRYSAESRLLTNGTSLLPNRGDQTAFGRLLLTGPHDAISIVHPGGTWTFPALASGSRLVDFREARVWNGNARVFGEGSGPWPRVLPGGSSWTVSGLGAGSAVLSRCEAWS